jgi:antitoxin PrlF
VNWYYFIYKVRITMESALTVKGQATIPKPIREHLGVEPGDRIKFFVHPDGTVVILPKIPTSALKGISSRRRKAPSIEEMHEAIVAGATAGIRRAKRS